MGGDCDFVYNPDDYQDEVEDTNTADASVAEDSGVAAAAAAAATTEN